MVVLDALGATELRQVITTFRDGLRSHQELINRLNVYPVPDGDTGTNMALTLESVTQEIEGLDSPDLDATCRAIAHGSLMGARGNSGRHPVPAPPGDRRRPQLLLRPARGRGSCARP